MTQASSRSRGHARASSWRHRRPIEYGAMVLGGVALVLRHRASRAREERSNWQVHLHHRVAQPLLAAERELARGNTPAAHDLIQDAVGQSRLLLDPNPDPHRADAVARDAAATAKRIWGPDLSLSALPVSGDLPRLGRRQRALVHAAVLESLANVARHQPGAPVRLGVQRQAGYLVVTIAATTDASSPAGPEIDSYNGSHPHGGFGLTHLRDEIRRAGGRLLTRFDAGGSLVALACPLHPLSRMRPIPISDTAHAGAAP